MLDLVAREGPAELIRRAHADAGRSGYKRHDDASVVYCQLSGGCVTTPRHSVSVAAVVLDDAGRALVIQRRDNGAWQLPGGVLELDEPIEAGVRREVLEETGLEVEAGG